MESYADLDLIPFLYNTCYGGYDFSDTFMERLNTLCIETGKPPYSSSYDLDRYTLRSDPMITSLFQEMGSEKASSACSDIQIKWIPRAFEDYVGINEHDGKEGVYVIESNLYKDLLKKFLREWKENPSLTVADLDDRYTNLEATLKRYHEFLSVSMKLRVR